MKLLAKIYNIEGSRYIRISQAHYKAIISTNYEAQLKKDMILMMSAIQDISIYGGKYRKEFYISTKNQTGHKNKAIRELVKMGLIVRNGYYSTTTLDGIEDICYYVVVNPLDMTSSYYNELIDAIKSNDIKSEIHKKASCSLYHYIMGHKGFAPNNTYITLSQVYKRVPATPKKQIIDTETSLIDFEIIGGKLRVVSDGGSEEAILRAYEAMGNRLKFNKIELSNYLTEFGFNGSLSELYDLDLSCNCKSKKCRCKKRNLRVIRDSIANFEFNAKPVRGAAGRIYWRISNLKRELVECLDGFDGMVREDIKAAQPTFLIAELLRLGYKIENSVIEATKSGKYYELFNFAYDVKGELIGNKRTQIKKSTLAFFGLPLESVDNTEKVKRAYNGKMATAIRNQYPLYYKAIQDIKSQGGTLAGKLQGLESSLLIPIALKYGGVTHHDELIVPKENIEAAMKEVLAQVEFIKFESKNKDGVKMDKRINIEDIRKDSVDNIASNMVKSLSSDDLKVLLAAALIREKEEEENKSKDNSKKKDS